MRSLVGTPYGPLPVALFTGEFTDSWWAQLEHVPEPLRQGGPTLATGATRELAIGVLKVAIERFEQCRGKGGGPWTRATAYQDVDGKWVLDVPTEGVSAIGPTLDRTIAMATDLVSDGPGALDVRFRNERRRAS
ncbi:MAG: hypothetical protein M3P04_12960 [Actinomycetota bacterium]|nr:hypothetical protein [Actinomycetota bacterium]